MISSDISLVGIRKVYRTLKGFQQETLVWWANRNTWALLAMREFELYNPTYTGDCELPYTLMGIKAEVHNEAPDGMLYLVNPVSVISEGVQRGQED